MSLNWLAIQNQEATLVTTFLESKSPATRDVRRDLKRGHFQQLSGPMGATQGQAV
jgi:hypothetical protein